VLKGNVNFTLATMTKLAKAVGGVVRVHLAPIGARTEWKDSEILETHEAIEVAPDEPKEQAQPEPKRRKAPRGSRPPQQRAPERHR
jgi:hypothetical protein